MIYIAHRALCEGPNPERENHPDQIKETLKLGFDCEIDLRLDAGRWMLGHDEPVYEVDSYFLCQPGLWIHCKNLEALAAIDTIPHRKFSHRPNYFWHQNDDYTLTSLGYIWTFPGRPVNASLGVRVQPELKKRWLDDVHDMRAAGVCSKFVAAIRELRSGAV